MRRSVSMSNIWQKEKSTGKAMLKKSKSEKPGIGKNIGKKLEPVIGKNIEPASRSSRFCGPAHQTETNNDLW